MKLDKKKKYIIILLLLVLSLSVGFALLQANLKINGSSKIKGSSWDIHFENLNVIDGSVALSNGDVAATIQSSRTDITYTVTLNLPGDYYEFTVDAVNAGTVDGMVESVISKLNNEPITSLPNYLKYSVTYETKDKIQVNHLLKAGKSETYKIRIEYKRDIDSTDMPTTAQTLSLSFGVVYVQANNNGIELYHPLNGIIYNVPKRDENVTTPLYNSLWSNEIYPETIPYFETPTMALSVIKKNSGKDLPFYLKHKVENGIVTEQYIEFIITDAMAQANSNMVPGTYTLRGEKTYDLDTSSFLVDESYISPYYETNKETIKAAFNNYGCSETGSGRSLYFQCDVSVLRVSANASGSVHAYSSLDYCCVSRTGLSACNWYD